MKKSFFISAIILSFAINYQPVQPSTLSLYQNYPTPFNPITKLRYQLPELSNVKLTVHNNLGPKLKLLSMMGLGYQNVLEIIKGLEK